MRSLMKVLLLGGSGAAAAPTASFTVTTTAPNQTLTINSLGVSAETTVEWGDGSSNAYTGTAQRTHQYAAAGVWTVRILQPELVTTLDIRDNKVTLNSADVKLCVNIQTAIFATLKAGTFDSADVSDWRPSNFHLLSMPAGYSGTFDSADVSAWRPSSFRLYSMPAGYAGTFDSADVSAWRPSTFYLFSMPSGYTFVISAGGFAGWITTTSMQMQGNALSQAQVDQILADFWAGFATRTATAGTINLGGTNAAPSGTLQAANPPSTGKEYAYCLVNDPDNVNPTKKWATVTITD